MQLLDELHHVREMEESYLAEGTGKLNLKQLVSVLLTSAEGNLEVCISPINFPYQKVETSPDPAYPANGRVFSMANEPKTEVTYRSDILARSPHSYTTMDASAQCTVVDTHPDTASSSPFRYKKKA